MKKSTAPIHSHRVFLQIRSISSSLSFANCWICTTNILTEPASVRKIGTPQFVPLIFFTLFEHSQSSRAFEVRSNWTAYYYQDKMSTHFGHDDGGEDLYVSIPLGGPLYAPDSIGRLTRVSDFETSVIQELQSLKDELYADSMETSDEDISVDELKIIREDELVNKAFEEAFKDGELAMDSSQVKDDKDNKKTNKKPQGKGAKRKPNCNNFDENYLVKVEQLARIKEKQEEDKASVRLHSFDSKEPRSGLHTRADKIKSLKSGSDITKVKASNPSDNVVVQFPETVLSIEVYHNKKPWLKTQEFLVLGRQFLSEVKDKIYCLTDEIMKKTGQFDHSGYFLIEDMFCNDMRKSSAIDYSKPILDWLQNSKNDARERWEFIVSGELLQKQKDVLGSESKQNLPRLKSLHMQSTRFRDLRFRLGAGYLYCHQGDCKHIIIICDMRLIHPEDVQSRSSYPLITFQSKTRYMKCSVCKIYKAEKFTVDDKWAPLNPCYFCNICYYMIHYSEGSLLYSDFKVYDYFHE